jgi:DNA-binding HxlR family transcriptional regulator
MRQRVTGASIETKVRQKILKALHDNGKEFGKLRAEVGVSKPTLSKYLDKMEGEGLVTHESPGEDKRKRVYALTGAVDKVSQIGSFLDELGELLKIAAGELSQESPIYFMDSQKIIHEILQEPRKKIDDRLFEELLLILGAGVVYALAEMRKRTALPKEEEIKMMANLPLRITPTQVRPKNWYKKFVGVDGEPIEKPKEYIAFSSDPNEKAKQLEAHKAFERYQELIRKYDESLKEGFNELALHVHDTLHIRDDPEGVLAKLSQIKIKLPKRMRRELIKYYVSYGLNQHGAGKLVSRYYAKVYGNINLREFLGAVMKISHPSYRATEIKNRRNR